MSNYIVSDTDLTSVANAIRTKGGTSASLEFPAGFVSAIGDIPSGVNLQTATVILAQDYAGFTTTAFELFSAAIGTDFFSACIEEFPSDHVMAESDAILFSAAILPGLNIIPGTSGYYDISSKAFARTFRVNRPNTYGGTSTSSLGIAGTKYKIWGWNA